MSGLALSVDGDGEMRPSDLELNRENKHSSC